MLRKPRAPLTPKISGMVYLLPNLLTTCNLFWGFYAIIASLKGEFTVATYAIFMAAVFDMLDGQVAKFTKTHSPFGVQLDSLSDLVSFGVAPAFLLYQHSLYKLDRVGWIVCFIFLACGALRLARFNVHNFHAKKQNGDKHSGDFVGLPIPASALILAGYVVFLQDIVQLDIDFYYLQQAIAFLTQESIVNGTFVGMSLCLSFCMVSSVAYRSHKSLDIKAIKPFKVLVLGILILAIIAYRPKVWAFILGSCYVLSGLLEWLLGWKKLSADDDIYPIDTDTND